MSIGLKVVLAARRHNKPGEVILALLLAACGGESQQAYNGSVALNPIGSCIRPIFRSRLIKQQF
jgi:hypothetical protein